MHPSTRYASERVLRLSVTDRCNFRCGYCMPRDARRESPLAATLEIEDLASLVAWLHPTVPFRKIKITGGEPLVRPGIPDLVARLRERTGVDDISLTTNGSRLASLAEPLKRAGLKRVNVSLDTVDANRFRMRTGGRLIDTLNGIDAALAAGLRPLKLNVVLQRSSWLEDVPALLDCASPREIEVRFIELMRTGTAADWIEREFVAVSEVRAWLGDRTSVVDAPRPRAAPARPSRVRWGAHTIDVGWISPETAPFCGDCDRVRLDSVGRLRRCLMDPRHLSIRELPRHPSQEVARASVEAYLRAKSAPNAMGMDSSMAAIGG